MTLRLQVISRHPKAEKSTYLTNMLLFMILLATSSDGKLRMKKGF